MRAALVTILLSAAAAPAAAETRVAPSEAYPTIQGAVAESGPGDIITVPEGVHTQSFSVSGKEGLRIRGAAGAILEGAEIEITGSTGIEIAGLTLRQAGNGIWTTDSADVLLRDLLLQDIENDALGVADCSGLRILRCTLRNVGGNGVQEERSTGVVIERSAFENCDTALFLSPFDSAPEDGPGVRVRRCTITGGGVGILAGGVGMIFDRNVITGTEGRAMDFRTVADANGAVISRNRIEDPGTDVAVDLDGDGIRFLRNTVRGGGVGENGEGNLLDRNRIEAAEWGIAGNGLGTVIRRNVVTGVDGLGIDLSGEGFTVDRNVLTDCGDGGMYVAATGCLVRGNRITGSAVGMPYGIVVFQAGNGIEGNRVAGDVTLDLWDQQPEGTNTYGKNAFRTEHFGPLN